MHRNESFSFDCHCNKSVYEVNLNYQLQQMTAECDALAKKLEVANKQRDKAVNLLYKIANYQYGATFEIHIIDDTLAEIAKMDEENNDT